MFNIFKETKKIKFDFIQTNPFYIFKIENFLSDDEYSFIYENFPKLENFNLKDIEGLHKKFSFNSRQKIYLDTLEKNKMVKFLHEKIFDKKFIKFFYQTLFNKIIITRLFDLKYLIKLIRFKRFGKKKRNFLDKFLFTDIFSDIEYSYLKNGAKIVPHTDSSQKMLSLMLYFPDKNLKEEEINKLGTTFYINKKKNINNKHLISENEEENLKKTSLKKITLPFKKKNIYGFLRNDSSWHTVEEFTIEKNFVRKSLNINLYF